MTDIDLTEAIEAGCKVEYSRRIREAIRMQNLPRGTTVSWVPWEEAGDAVKEEIRRDVSEIVRAAHRPIARQAWDICRAAEMAWNWAATCHRYGFTTKQPGPPPRNPYEED